eukprot:3834519-Rhodomonas_salina.3
MCTCSQVTVQRSVSRTASTTRTSHQSSDHPPHAMAGLLRSLTSSLRHTRPLASQLFSSARSSTLPANFQVSRAAASRPFTATALARAEQEAAVTEEVQQQANTTDFVQYDEDPDQASTFQRYGEGAIYPPKRKGKDWVAQLHLKSFDKNQIQYACGYVKHLAALSGVQTGGAIPLPKRTLLVSLIRSPHVHKTSQEQFHQITYKRLICCYDTAPDVLEKFFDTLDERPPQGVQVKVKQRSKISPPEGKP